MCTEQVRARTLHVSDNGCPYNDQQIKDTLVRNCPQVPEIDWHDHLRYHEILKPRTLDVSPLAVCISCSRQSPFALFIFRIVFQHLADPENQRTAGYTCTYITSNAAFRIQTSTLIAALPHVLTNKTLTILSQLFAHMRLVSDLVHWLKYEYTNPIYWSVCMIIYMYLCARTWNFGTYRIRHDTDEPAHT